MLAEVADRQRDCHRHYLSDNAEPMLNARQCRVARGVIPKFNCVPF
jgi:hypothetical protein